MTIQNPNLSIDAVHTSDGLSSLRVNSLRQRSLMLLAVATLGVLGGCEQPSMESDAGPMDAALGADGGPTALGFAAACTEDDECLSGICFLSGGGAGTCTEACDPEASECLAGWNCGAYGSGDSCLCLSTAESCDGMDNDCDGLIDEGTPSLLGCGEGQLCTGGTCECPDENQCDGGCIDTRRDVANCGVCGNSCGGDQRCSQGSCCTPSAEVCNGLDDDCDGSIDEGAGASIGCAATEQCVSGSCQCPDSNLCGGVCVDLEMNGDHCGSCDNACSDGLDCVGGTCCEAAGTRVDLLLMIDNSNSMTEEQLSLIDELPAIIEVLSTGDLDGDGVPERAPVRDLHIGVVTSDMGTGGYAVPTCDNSNVGDDAILQRVGNPGHLVANCSESYPPVLTFETGDDADAFAHSAACVAALGIGGCGFEQPLEAVLKALTPSTSATRFVNDSRGHQEMANSGFLREDSLLVVLMLTDEEDCSVADPDLLNPYSSVYGHINLNLRCAEEESSEALHPLNRYVEGLLALREDPRDLIFAPITGVPMDLATGGSVDYDAILSDPRMVAQINPEQPTRHLPSCVSASGEAMPPRRIVRVAQALQERGAATVVGSICQADFGGPAGALLDRITSRLNESCGF